MQKNLRLLTVQINANLKFRIDYKKHSRSRLTNQDVFLNSVGVRRDPTPECQYNQSDYVYGFIGYMMLIHMR